MAAEYLITQNSTDSHQMNPYWIVAFIPIKNRVSFDPIKMKSTQAALQDPSGAEDIIIADGDTQSVSVSSSKENHVSGCTISLIHDAIDYRQVVAGGDWVAVWMFDNQTDYTRIRKALVDGTFKNGLGDEGLNGVQDGFKFIGRVSSCRQKKTRQADGRMSVTYTVAANGFTELDSTQYFNPLLSKAHPESVQYLSDFGIEVDKLLGTNGLVNAQQTIPTIINACLGYSPRQAASKLINWSGPPTGDSSFDQIRDSIQNETSPNRVYQIPSVVLGLLGMKSLPSIKNSQPTYSDMLRVYIGVHTYLGGSNDDLSGFVPQISTAANGVFSSADPLQSVAIPQAINFNMQSAWSISKMFLNEPVNEMYTCLRVDPSGHVMPTIMIRQLPLSLPRWVVDDSMIYDVDTGRSDASRINYLHISGQDQYAQNPNQGDELALLVAPPIVDTADIFRSGLRMFEARLSASLNLVVQGQDTQAASFFSNLLADTMINGQLKYQGQVTLNGVQVPITEGDNCVIEGIIYHIERVSHQCGYTDPSRGIKSFVTTLDLTNGVSIDSDDDKNGLFVYPGDSGDVALQKLDPEIKTNNQGGE